MEAANHVHIESEIGALEKVVVHSPGPEWDLVPGGPRVLQRFLIEDLFVLDRARIEHERLTTVLRFFTGADNVLEFSDLLAHVCRDDSTRDELLGAITALEGIGIENSRRLRDLDASEFAAALIRGSLLIEGNKSTYSNIFPPLPNLLFTRDIGAAIPGGFIVCHAATPARRRETLLMRYVLRHPVFLAVDILDIRNYERLIFWAELERDEYVSIEGGDIAVLDEKTIMVGTGERTTPKAIDLLLDLLGSESTVQKLISAVVPKDRASMHLDTIVTMTDRQEFIASNSVLQACRFWLHWAPFEKDDRDGPWSFDEVMERAGFHGLRQLNCGNQHKLFESREQWTDGANLFAVYPGVVVGYDRNVETANALSVNGVPPYRYLDAGDEKQLKEIQDLATHCRSGAEVTDHILVGIPGSELSRARGGPRCMTMPLARKPLPTAQKTKRHRGPA